jgi:glycosyltransferase involved in cell wall biosynthesis
MRILLTFEYPFTANGYGGGQQITRGLARALVRRGCEVHVACSGTDDLRVAAADAPVEYHFTGGFDPRFSGMQVARIAIPLMGRLRPDLVCAFTSETPWVLSMARLRGARAVTYLAAPLLPSFRGVSLSTLRELRCSFGLYLQRVGTRAGHKVLTLSDYLATRAREQWNVPTDRLDAIGIGLDEAVLAHAITPPPPLTCDGLRVVSVGRLVFSQKPLDVAARALAAAPECWSRWTIVGTGPDDAALRALVSELGIAERVEFLGTISSTDVSRQLDSAHVALLPSRHESFFLTAYESVARGRPVLTNAVADLPRDFAGWRSVRTLPTHEPADFVYALREWYAEYPPVAEAALASAHAVHSRYNWDAVADRLLIASGLPDRAEASLPIPFTAK